MDKYVSRKHKLLLFMEKSFYFTMHVKLNFLTTLNVFICLNLNQLSFLRSNTYTGPLAVWYSIDTKAHLFGIKGSIPAVTPDGLFSYETIQ